MKNLSIILFIVIGIVVFFELGLLLKGKSPNLNGVDSENSQTFSLQTPDGRMRSYFVYLPTVAIRSKKVAASLVIVLHGSGENGRFVEKASGFSHVADTYQFIVVYPEGTGDTSLSWNGKTCCSYAEAEDVDDVTFLDMLIDKLIAAYDVNPDRIYLAGFSNGGLMAYRYACEGSRRIAAIGTVTGGPDAFVHCEELKSPVSIINFRALTRKRWDIGGDNVQWLGCKGGTVRSLVVNDYEPRVRYEWIDACKESIDSVGYYFTQEWRHEWFTVPIAVEHAGLEPGIYTAAELIWNFFARHPKVHP